MSLETAINTWTPRERPHCSNCGNTEVFGNPDDPMVRCKHNHTMMHGHFESKGELSLEALIRAKNPACFAAASRCPDFESMNEEVER